jgi:RNA polymerase sigma-70 factor (ECF subfamily)
VATFELPVSRFANDERDEDLTNLVDRTSKGDEQAFVALVKRLESTIRRWAAKLSTDPDSADDLTQLTLIRLHERAGQFDRRSRLTSWLYGMMHNLAADTRRADARRILREQHLSLAMPDVDAAETDDESARERLAAVLASYRTMLSARERQVFELVDLRGMATAEASTRLRIAPATVRVLLLRARRKLRSQMLNGLMPEEGGSR